MIVDPSGAFRPFIDELGDHAGWTDQHPETWEIQVAGEPARLAIFDGSWLGLRAALEPHCAGSGPPEPPVLIYAATSPPRPHHDVLMELVPSELRLRWDMDSQARACLRGRFSDPAIDEALAGGSASYDDVVRFLDQQPDRVSKLDAIFPHKSKDDILLAWLVDEGKDASIAQKGAVPELYQIAESRLGSKLSADTDLSSARQRLARYLLVGEFRLDLQSAAPASVSMIPEPPSPGHGQQLRDLVKRFRERHPDAYASRADQVQQELHLATAQLDPATLGRIDTFRFEERRLLDYCASLLTKGAYADAMALVVERSESFWVERDVQRKAQWELCRRVANLGLAIEAVRRARPASSSDPDALVARYAAPDGWHRVDSAQPALESWRTQLAEPPACEQAVALVLRAHEKLLHQLAERFSDSLASHGWTLTDTLHQTRIHPTLVEPKTGVVAYILVDALRFEMGAELARMLEGVEELQLQPAVCALPSITAVGMPALLPGAANDFAVVPHGSGLAARVDGVVVASAADREKHLRSRVPKVFVTQLDTLVGYKESHLTDAVKGKSLVLVQSTDIDAVGENISDLAARRAMIEVLGDITRAVSKLARAGVEHFVITADHGHLFGLRKSDDMKTDAPGGDTVALHRRCWAGRGGTTPAGTQRVPAAQLGYASDLEFVFPTGLGVLKAGGDLSFHHGGTSLQEMVIPVLSFRVPRDASRDEPTADVKVGLVNLPPRITNRMFVVGVQVTALHLFETEPVALRVVLLSSKGRQVGHAGMATGGRFDSSAGVIHIEPGKAAQLGLALTHDDEAELRIAAIDPDTSAVLAQSDLIPVDLQR